MSDPSNQRADGCSIFFTFLVLFLLLSGFYVAQRIFEPEQPPLVTEAVDNARSAKVAEHREQNEQFMTSVDKFHADNNTTLESSMNEVLIKYRSNFRAKQKQTN